MAEQSDVEKNNQPQDDFPAYDAEAIDMYLKCFRILRAIFIWGTRAITPSVMPWLAKPA